jgi:hypothetical protein
MEQEEQPKKKKWPKEYYATKRECSLEHLRHAKLKDSKRKGFVAWRKKDNILLS